MVTPFDLDDVPTDPPPRRPPPRGVNYLALGATVFAAVLLAEVAHTLLALATARWLVLRALGQ